MRVKPLEKRRHSRRKVGALLTLEAQDTLGRPVECSAYATDLSIGGALITSIEAQGTSHIGSQPSSNHFALTKSWSRELMRLEGLEE